MRASSSVGAERRSVVTGTHSSYAPPIIIAGILTASLPLAAQEEPLRRRTIGSIANAAVRKDTTSIILSM